MAASVLTKFRSFDRVARVLMVNQFGINAGFYMLMPYLAVHLSLSVGLAGWLVGLILGVRNFSQQGMFLLGGALADRFGYKPLIMAGCLFRTGGFATLGLTSSVLGLIAGAAATGFAGALFNPAVRAYLAAESGGRRVEAFAMFNVFYQAGILAGPLIGLALTTLDFQLTCLVAAALFAVLTGWQWRALPAQQPVTAAAHTDVIHSWRAVLGNRRFIAFAAAMTGSYVLLYQTYQLLPVEARRLAGSPAAGSVGIAVLFAVSGLVAVAGQLRITAWCQARWSPGQCLAGGLALMGAAFLPPLLTSAVTGGGPPARLAVLLAPLAVSAALLALGAVVVFPFEMDTIIALAQDRVVATHYGLYNTICGAGIAVGTLGTGAVHDLAARAGLPWLPWIALAATGAGCAAAVTALARAGKLQPATPPQPP